MTHTLAAVFDKRDEAERAKAELVGAGFASGAIVLNDASGDDTAHQQAHRKESSGIMNFFNSLFGNDHEDRHVYTEAVSRGNVVLTITTDSEDEVERAADILERFGPLDIDEQQKQWRAGQAHSAAQNVQSAQGGLSQQDAAQSGSMQRGENESGSSSGSQTIPVIQEQLKVGKRTVQRGGVRVYQRVIETPVQQDVKLREEHVSVERHAVDKAVDPADVTAFQETTFELRENAEEAVVEKSARVVEEVVVGKQVSERQDQISDTLRSTAVEVEQLGASGDDDERHFRSHWQSNLAGSGDNYEEYDPAYRYGSSMASSSAYRGRSWKDVETDLRKNWENSYPKSAWAKFKAAIREGWDRMTG